MELNFCRVCPRNCGVDRAVTKGVCGSGEKIRVARAALHLWEEPPISGKNGAGAVFFTGCSLGCIYCQNREISSGASPPGRDVTPEELSGIFSDLISQGAHNIDLVTPTHFAPLVREALALKKPAVPVLWNSSGYETVETLRTLEGLVDIYLPDFKYADPALARDLSHAPDYPDIALAALGEMVRQAGPPVYDEDGMMKRGVLVRHLILPGHTRNSLAVLELLHREFPELPVSLMAQYTPPENFPEGEKFPELTRRITRRELEKVQNRMFELGMDGFLQERSSAKDRYLPDFHQFDKKEGHETMDEITAVLVSSLEKVFPDDEPAAGPDRGSALRGELFSYQIALKKPDCGHGLGRFTWKVESPLRDAVKVFRVEQVPCGLAAYPGVDRQDSDYLSYRSGLFPDLLCPLEENALKLSVYQNTVLWVDVRVPEDCPAGEYPIELTVEGEGFSRKVVFTLKVIGAALPRQDLLFTQWFHTDCLATYYKVPVHSEEHWRIIENFLREAVDHGMNTVLTPVLTPALDTGVGTERPCVQLADIEKTGDGYRFGFEKLRRFVNMALDCGVTHFEISHLFSQWGAEFAPNIYVTENGVRSLKFGWHTKADSPEYVEFIKALVPAVIRFFTDMGLRDRILFHISDEPGEQHLDMYRKHVALVSGLVGDLPIMDALSSIEFYDQGLVKRPVPATNHIEPFLERKVPGLWAYYCCGQGVDVGNRFLSMPSYRNRIVGLQCWKFGLAGFLHWGYDFWYSQSSLWEIDPFRVTDGGGAFPGGDPFSVYPGEGGHPLPSLRLKVFCHGLQDMRALALLESLGGRKAAEDCVPGLEELTFASYPRNAGYLPAMREAVNAAIEKLVNS